jgi:hypothetical protein
VNEVREQHPCLRRRFTRKCVPIGRVDRGEAMIRVVIVQLHASPFVNYHDAELHHKRGEGLLAHGVRDLGQAGRHNRVGDQSVCVRD